MKRGLRVLDPRPVEHPDYGVKVVANPDRLYEDNDPLVLAYPSLFVDVSPDDVAPPSKPSPTKKRAAKA